MNAVVAERLSKSYRRFARRRGAGSLKSAVLHAFRGGPPAADAVFPALSDVSFTIAAGETVGVLGENGS